MIGKSVKRVCTVQNVFIQKNWGRMCIVYLNKMALAYPSIKFKLTNNGKTLLDTVGDGDLLKVIYSIYGVDVAKKMIEVSGENDDYYISGYISTNNHIFIRCFFNSFSN